MDINDQVLSLIRNWAGLVKRYETALKTAEEMAVIFERLGYVLNAKEYSAIKALNHFIKADLSDVVEVKGARDPFLFELRLISAALDDLLSVIADGMLTRRVSFYNSDEASHVSA